MSDLFGSSPPRNSRVASNNDSTLFGEDSTPRKATASGLFADDTAEAEDSPWGFTPKKQARSNLVQTLLPASDVPESYIDTYEGLVEGNTVPYARLQELVEGSRLSRQAQDQIVGIVLPQGSGAGRNLGRGEFNVLLALIGLAQEGEEVSLDSVDDRKRRKDDVY